MKRNLKKKYHTNTKGISGLRSVVGNQNYLHLFGFFSILKRTGNMFFFLNKRLKQFCGFFYTRVYILYNTYIILILFTYRYIKIMRSFCLKQIFRAILCYIFLTFGVTCLFSSVSYIYYLYTVNK